MKPQGASNRGEKVFPVFRPSFRPLRTGLEYGMTVQGRPMPAPNVALPIQSSTAQDVNVHRFQITRNLRLLRNYGMRPDHPVLRAPSIPFTAKVNAQTPKPVMTRLGTRPVPGATPVFPRTGAPGTMGSVKRFPKAILAMPNRYRPPVYGGRRQQGAPGKFGFLTEGDSE